MKKNRIVTIGGGSGQYALLSALRDIPNISISSVVSMADSGGSTGRLRDELGILPPGDILKCLVALSPNREYARQFLLHRFKDGNRLKDHSVGNMLLTFLSQYSGSFPEGVKALAEMLEVKHNIFPVTTDKATLVAELTDGSRIFGEAAIDVPRGGQREKIRQAYLVPHHSGEIKVYDPVIKAILEANYIIIGPGDLYTSIIPNFLVPGVRDAVVKSKAKLVYVSNIMTKFGETDNFSLRDFIDRIEEMTRKKLDCLLVNNKKPKPSSLKRYREEKANFIEPNKKALLGPYTIYTEDFLEESPGVIRHNSEKLNKIIKKIVK